MDFLKKILLFLKFNIIYNIIYTVSQYFALVIFLYRLPLSMVIFCLNYMK